MPPVSFLFLYLSTPVSCCLHYHTFILSLSVWEGTSSHPTFFQDCFGYSWPSVLLYKFGISLSCSLPEACHPCWYFDWPCIECVDQVGESRCLCISIHGYKLSSSCVFLSMDIVYHIYWAFFNVFL